MVKSKQICDFLNTKFYGNQSFVECYTSIDQPKENSILFLKNKSNKNLKQLMNHDKCIIILPKEMKGHDNFKDSWGYIFSEDPRSTFFQIINEFFMEANPLRIDSSAYISNDTEIGINSSIGKNTNIIGNCIIGDNVTIGSNVLIIGPCKIGDNTSIASGVIIGEESLSIRYENELAVQNPQLGGVIIGKNSRIGVFSTISRGSIGDTVLGENVFLGEYAHVGHNSYVSNNSVLTIRSSICGSVNIMKKCWLGPHSVILNGVIVHEKIKLGINSVLQTNVKKPGTYFGNPAKLLEFMQKNV